MWSGKSQLPCSQWLRSHRLIPSVNHDLGLNTPCAPTLNTLSSDRAMLPRCRVVLKGRIRQGSTNQEGRGQFEAIWGKFGPWTRPSLGPYMRKWFSKTWASFLGLDRQCFSSKWCQIEDAPLCLFLVLDPHLKAFGPICTSPPIGLLHFVEPSPLDPHLKCS